MRLPVIGKKLWFPPVEKAMDDGLLAAGGDLSKERLLLAYQNGIFPWFNEGDPPLWWCPDPRFVLFPQELRVSKSMKQDLKSGNFEFRVDTSFCDVLNNCRAVYRHGQGGTWITDEVVAGYTALHHAGYVHSAEAWSGGELVGGLYGVKLGNIFFGESMFSLCSNASKFAFINWVLQLQQAGCILIDCQLHTNHLQSLGARMITRKDFMGYLEMGGASRSCI